MAKDDKKRALENIKECEQGGGKELLLSGYGLTLVPNVVYDKFAPSLRIASLEFNAFGVFPDLSPFTLLTEVRLSGNQIVTLNMLKLMVKKKKKSNLRSKKKKHEQHTNLLSL